MYGSISKVTREAARAALDGIQNAATRGNLIAVSTSDVRLFVSFLAYGVRQISAGPFFHRSSRVAFRCCGPFNMASAVVSLFVEPYSASEARRPDSPDG
jgi:hypothetical protein